MKYLPSNVRIYLEDYKTGRGSYAAVFLPPIDKGFVKAILPRNVIGLKCDLRNVEDYFTTKIAMEYFATSCVLVHLTLDELSDKAPALVYLLKMEEGNE